MPINSDKPHLWKADITRSINSYNDCFLRFAPAIHRKKCVIFTKEVLTAFDKTGNVKTRQLAALKRWLLRQGYKQIASDETGNLDAMLPGTFSIPPARSTEKKKTPANIPIDCVVKPIHADKQDQPIVIEVKSSANATNTLRSRKKEDRKFAQLKEHYGENVRFILSLCGNFDPFYLGYQAAEGIDWVWEHRPDDLGELLARGTKSIKYQ